jgi:uncharacterized protein
MSIRSTEQVVDFIFSDRYLKLTILPTEKCNFRCQYCYEDFANGRMSSDVVDGIKKLIKARASSLDILEITWFGGEPLLASDIVLDISKFSKEIASTYNDLRFYSNATTNGHFLNVPLMTQLIDSGVTSFQISLDGPKEYHDKTRLTANGSGSYDRIVENLIALRASELSFNILLRVHITPINVSSMPDFIRDLSRTFNDSRFRIFFQTIQHLGGPNDDHFQVIGQNRETLFKELYKIIADNSDNIGQHEVADDYVCYASRANAFVIRSTGGIGKCTVALEDDRNLVGSITADGRVRLLPEKIRPWLRGVENLDFSILSCPAAGYLHDA